MSTRMQLLSCMTLSNERLLTLRSRIQIRKYVCWEDENGHMIDRDAIAI